MLFRAAIVFLLIACLIGAIMALNEWDSQDWPIDVDEPSINDRTLR